MPSPTRHVLLIDDHGLVRHGLQLLINETLPGVQVQLAGSLTQALQLLATQAFDLLLLDLTLSDVHGMTGLLRLREAHPETPVVVLSAQDDRDTVLAALDAGGMGFISKSAAPDELREALTGVLVDGAIHLPRSVSAPRSDGRDLSSLGLTARQTEVLGHVVQGLSNKEIARRLQRSEVVVKKHVTAALQVLGVTNRTKALLALSQRGYRIGGVHPELADGDD